MQKYRSSSRGLFKCLNCNYQCNADYNGAINILKRAMGYMPIVGAERAISSGLDTAHNSVG